MKNLILIIMVIAAPLLGMSQNRSLNTFYEKYAGTEGFTTVTVHEELFKLLASLEEVDMEAATKGLKAIKVLVKEDAADSQSLRLYQEAIAAIPKENYKELVTVKDGADNVRIMAQEGDKKGIVRNLLIIVSSDAEFVFVSIEGDIDLSKFSEAAKDSKIQGLDKLENIKKN